MPRMVILVYTIQEYAIYVVLLKLNNGFRAQMYVFPVPFVVPIILEYM